MKTISLLNSPGVLLLAAVLSSRGADQPVDIHRDFYVRLPAQKRPFPETLAPGANPGFAIRGAKGYAWTPEQYLAEIPWLVQFKMNFLMNCYFSMFDLEHHPVTGNAANRWWEELPPGKKLAYEQVVSECQKQGIQFCFSMNPNLRSGRLVNDNSNESIDLLYRHYAWMQELGVKWFNISLNDATEGIDASAHSHVVNEIFHRLRANDPEARMIFCPTYYWGNGTEKARRPYLETLARELDADVYLFWTGGSVVGKVTRHDAESYRRICGHRLFLWDYYPSNEGTPTMHLGPVIDRDTNLCEVVDGYMCNSLGKQNDINRLPLATCADYAYNPRAYDPGRSIGQAILYLAPTTRQRETLSDLVETYPGMLICSKESNCRTDFNAVQDQFGRIIMEPNARQAALAYIEHLQTLSDRMKADFPSVYVSAHATLDQDIQSILKEFSAAYP